MRKCLLFSLVFGALLLPAAALADAHSEIVGAAKHADLATQAHDLAAVRMHLHHALNCLVGPRGAGFYVHATNPCAKAGHGAIPDSNDAQTKATLEAAAAKARAGIAESDIAIAKTDAADTVALLQKYE
ncbi:MAG: hypothetical protein KGM97_00665 [Alphaproteobacteria bacterium]|nr:hypothetical protein [Alphaproteobacteria bacterium]MDE2629474.1 hypothetical protein [Alphaproteobacteria bacterium]